jgi:hypothetical protein
MKMLLIGLLPGMLQVMTWGIVFFGPSGIIVGRDQIHRSRTARLLEFSMLRYPPARRLIDVILLLIPSATALVIPCVQ